MSIWLEIHCDVKNAPSMTGRCANHDNDNPGLMITGGVTRGYKVLKKMALQKGWKFSRVGWSCPYCATMEK